MRRGSLAAGVAESLQMSVPSSEETRALGTSGSATHFAESTSPAGRLERPSVVLIGTAHTAETVEAVPSVSAAAAAWQQDFAKAIAAERDVAVCCLSYVKLASGQQKPPISESERGIEIVPVCRGAGAVGVIEYGVTMCRAVWRRRTQPDVVFCYNALVWTTPWAWLLSKLARAPLVVIIAELQPQRGPRSISHWVLWAFERAFLRLCGRFVVLFPAPGTLIRWADRVVVLNGVANETALAAAEPEYSATLRFVYAGSLTEEWGLTDFFETARIIASEGRRCEFHVFGRGNLPESVRNHWHESVTVHGFVPEAELIEFLGKNCVGVNPRRASAAVNELNAPYKLLFFLSRGVVTMTTDTHGVPTDLREVALVVAEGPEGLAAGVRRVLEMSLKDLRIAAARGRERVRETRSSKAVAFALRELLDDAVK